MMIGEKNKDVLKIVNNYEEDYGLLENGDMLPVVMKDSV